MTDSISARCLFLGGIALSVALWGCGGSGNGGSTTSKTATVRYVNSVPDSNSLDFRLDETTQGGVASLAYEGSSTKFATVKSGDHDVDFVEHGQVQPLWSEADPFDHGTDDLVVAVGEEGFGSEFLKRPQLIYYPIDLTVPNGSKSRLIVVNGLVEAPGVPTPAIDFTNPGNNPLFGTGGHPVPPAVATTLLIDSGSQEFIARQTDTMGSYVDKTFSFAPGKVYLMLVTGIVGGSPAPDIVQIELQTK